MAALKACRLAAQTAAEAPTTTTSLRHLRIASSAATHSYPAYADVERLQGRLQRALLSWKAAAAAAAMATPSAAAENTTPSRSSQLPAPPAPSLISFTPQPTYTLGRRQTAPVDDTERARLTAPLTVFSSSSPSSRAETASFTPAVVNAPRGGLATYHGPGQVVFWPVIDLHSPLHRNFSVRDYACLLEKTTIAALATFTAGRLRGFTTENPGVWVRHGETAADGVDGAPAADNERDERKISALGVHLRRHVTGLGVAVNFGMPVSGPEAMNPWARIVACGIGDKRVTSIAAETGAATAGLDVTIGQEADSAAAELADVWAAEFATRLGLPTAAAAGSTEEIRLGAMGASLPAVTLERVIPEDVD
ncbi:hypothetical protein Micbo1qcDRAFT_38700 [Microdochium bolleyi]|uniref:BPL/LPL catalytic domain-containing protein n=1 Tax=Microdochium bolleyi TaxID=196109 RepID=A0A136J9G6_9PEZI|nr:hypothetical protein Micbo1qcDRAFT_38700 [Microdochium bolleyi]